MDGILTQGGTILRTSRTNVRKIEGGIEKCVATIKANKLDALIAIMVATIRSLLRNALIQGPGVAGCGRSQNQLIDRSQGTDVCFGFDTAVGIATEASTACNTTAEAHNRVIVCEVMGRDAGWIALTAGVALVTAHVIWFPKSRSTLITSAR